VHRNPLPGTKVARPGVGVGEPLTPRLPPRSRRLQRLSHLTSQGQEGELRELRLVALAAYLSLLRPIGLSSSTPRDEGNEAAVVALYGLLISLPRKKTAGHVVDEFPPLLRGRRLGSVPRPHDRKRWKQLRIQIGMRDGWRCQVPQGDGICGAPARELDHIVPISRGGSAWACPDWVRTPVVVRSGRCRDRTSDLLLVRDALGLLLVAPNRRPGYSSRTQELAEASRN
jgi:hypothetical protein